MRFAAVIAVVLQLIVRGASVPHQHVHSGKPESANHSSRPHVHLAGHSHSHAPGHRHTHHLGHHSNHDTPVKSAPLVPSPDSSEHDDDSLYLTDYEFIASSDRSQIPGPSGGQWLLADIGANQTAMTRGRIEHRVMRPPGEHAPAFFVCLPHVLRI